MDGAVGGMLLQFRKATWIDVGSRSRGPITKCRRRDCPNDNDYTAIQKAKDRFAIQDDEQIEAISTPFTPFPITP